MLPAIFTLLLALQPPPQPAPDTARLAALLQSVRGALTLSPTQFRKIQSAYIAWLDARMAAARPIDDMNRELQSAGLLLPEPWDFFKQPPTGYLEPLTARPAHSTPDITLLDAGIFRAQGCSLDSTAVVYTRNPNRRLAVLNVNSNYPAHLSGFDAAPAAPNGARLLASGWTVSNCTSTWNGKFIRIHHASPAALHLILARSLSAQSGFEEEDVAPRIQANHVTFRYQGATGDGDFLSLPTLARYRVIDNTATRIAPLALTRAGFLHEWLQLSTNGAARWAEPQTLALHHTEAKTIQPAQWTHAARCPGPTEIWEIGLRPYESKDTYLFRLKGARAADLRLLSLHKNIQPACPAPALDITPLGAPLPD